MSTAFQFFLNKKNNTFKRYEFVLGRVTCPLFYVLVADTDHHLRREPITGNGVVHDAVARKTAD